MLEQSYHSFLFVENNKAVWLFRHNSSNVEKNAISSSNLELVLLIHPFTSFFLNQRNQPIFKNICVVEYIVYTIVSNRKVYIYVILYTLYMETTIKFESKIRKATTGKYPCYAVSIPTKLIKAGMLNFGGRYLFNVEAEIKAEEPKEANNESTAVQGNNQSNSV